jgi:hypothetical protein
MFFIFLYIKYLDTKNNYNFIRMPVSRKSKKNLSKKRKNVKRIKKTRKHIRKMRGGDNILDSDIMYKDNNVSILYPDVKKGVLIFTSYNNPEGKDLCIEGLKSGAQLKNEGINFGRRIYHPYIFFRAPFKYNNDFQYNKSTIDLDIINLGFIKDGNKIFIRVDPDYTYVYPSEIRSDFFGNNNKIQRKLQKYKITLSEYLILLNTNRTKLYKDISYEILVELPKLTPDFFVLCNNNEINHKLLSNDEKQKFRETVESESKLYQNKIKDEKNEKMREKNNLKKETFVANYIQKYGVYECPICEGRGKKLDNIYHSFDCENKNKTAISENNINTNNFTQSKYSFENNFNNKMTHYF